MPAAFGASPAQITKSVPPRADRPRTRYRHFGAWVPGMYSASKGSVLSTGDRRRTDSRGELYPPAEGGTERFSNAVARWVGNEVIALPSGVQPYFPGPPPPKVCSARKIPGVAFAPQGVLGTQGPRGSPWSTRRLASRPLIRQHYRPPRRQDVRSRKPVTVAAQIAGSCAQSGELGWLATERSAWLAPHRMSSSWLSDVLAVNTAPGRPDGRRSGWVRSGSGRSNRRCSVWSGCAQPWPPKVSGAVISQSPVAPV